MRCGVCSNCPWSLQLRYTQFSLSRALNIAIFGKISHRVASEFLGKIIPVGLDAGTGNCQEHCRDVGDKNPFGVADLCPAPAKSHFLLCLLLSQPLSLALRSEVSHTPALLMENLKNLALPVESQRLDDRGLGAAIACWKIIVSMLLLQTWSLDTSGLHSSLVANMQTLRRGRRRRLRRGRSFTR